MYSLNEVIKRFNSIIDQYKKSKGKDCIEVLYYSTIVKYLLLEHENKYAVIQANKQIYHYFTYSLPEFGNDYFEFIYHRYNPVRFAVETFDSIEEIKNRL